MGTGVVGRRSVLAPGNRTTVHPRSVRYRFPSRAQQLWGKQGTGVGVEEGQAGHDGGGRGECQKVLTAIFLRSEMPVRRASL